MLIALNWSGKTIFRCDEENFQKRNNTNHIKYTNRLLRKWKMIKIASRNTYFFYQAFLYLILICFVVGVYIYRWEKGKSGHPRKYIWYMGTDNVSIRTYVIHFEFRLLNTLILHSFLVIMKLEALDLVPHQDLWKNSSHQKFHFLFNFNHGKFQTYSRFKE